MSYDGLQRVRRASTSPAVSTYRVDGRFGGRFPRRTTRVTGPVRMSSSKYQSSGSSGSSSRPNRELSFILPNHRNLAVRSVYTDNVYYAFRQLIRALMGQKVIPQEQRNEYSGGGNGGGGGGRRSARTKFGGEGFYKEIIDTLVYRKCIPCVHPCLQQMRVNIDVSLVVKYTQTLFQSIDTAFRHHHNITLSEYVFHAVKRVSPGLGVFAQYKVFTKSTGGRVFKYVLTDVVAEVIPSKVHGSMYASAKPEILKFLAKGGADISMLASAAARYVMNAYQVKGFSLPSVPCMLCHAFNAGCNERISRF